MDIVQTDLSKIIPYERNNRQHPPEQIDRIANSIAEFGFNQPLVIDEKNIIIVGHGRFHAAKKLGLHTVPALILKNLSETKKRAYRILDNKLQNDSLWDFDNIKLELDQLVDDGFDLHLWGLEELRELAPLNEPEVYEDEAPPVPAETYIKRGDLIELGNHRLLCGDCRNLSTGFFPARLDLIMTDPPYGVSYTGKTKEKLEIENDSLSEPELSEPWNAALDAIWTYLKPGGVIYASVPAGPILTVFVDALKHRSALRQELVWLKDSMVLGRTDYHYKHEPILYGWKPGAAHYVTADRSKTSVLEHARPKASREHPTMKPISLWAELMNNSSRPGDIVADPFLGSGTTLIAADQLGRVCCGVEIEPKYCQVIIDRYKNHCEKVGKPFKCKVNGGECLETAKN